MSVDDEFERLLAGARADDAARSRSIVGALRERATEDASVTGVLTDLADHRCRVRLSVRGVDLGGVVGSVCAGGVELLGVGTVSLVRLGAIDAVSCLDGHRFDGDERRVSAMGWIALVGSRLERDDVVVATVSGATVRGSVRTIGRDVITLVTPDGSTTYVRTDAIDAVSFASTRSTSI